MSEVKCVSLCVRERERRAVGERPVEWGNWEFESTLERMFVYSVCVSVCVCVRLESSER